MERTIVRAVFKLLGKIRMAGHELGADVGDRHVSHVVDVDLVLAVATIGDCEFLIRRPIHRTAAGRPEGEHCNKKKNAAYKSRSPRYGLGGQDEDERQGEPIGG